MGLLDSMKKRNSAPPENKGTLHKRFFLPTKPIATATELLTGATVEDQTRRYMHRFTLRVF
jgi:hypothetical protein